MAVSGCRVLPNMVTERCLRFFGHITHSVPDETITVQLLPWFTSLHQTGNDLQEDPTTWAYESDLRPLNIGPSYVWNKAASREH